MVRGWLFYSAVALSCIVRHTAAAAEPVAGARPQTGTERAAATPAGAAVVPATGERVGGGQGIELLRTLEAKGKYIRLEGESLFLTSDIDPKSQPAGYWFDTGADPAAPTLVSAALPGAWDIAVAGEYAFVCDYTSAMTVCSIRGQQWQPVAKLPLPDRSENIVIRGSLAYIATHYGGLTVADISVPTKPVLVSRLNPKIDCDAIGLWQDCAVLYGHQESRLVLVNVRDPAKPEQTAVYQHGPGTFIQGEMEVVDGVAYCTAGKSGLVIVSVADPANPRLVKVVDLKGVSDVIVRDGYAFVASEGVRVLDVHDPSTPVAVGRYNGSASQLAVKRVGSDYYIYVANPTAALVLRFRAATRGDDGAQAR